MKKGLIIFPILLSLLVIQVLFIGNGAVFGSSVSELDKKIEKIQEENQILEKEIAIVSSCTKIAENNINTDFSSIIFGFKQKKIDELKVALRP